MPRISDSLPINNPLLDRRVKLTDAQKEEIRRLYFSEANQNHVYSTRYLARMFNVSKRLIQFVLYPERAESVGQRAKEVKRWKKNYDKNTHTIAIRKHRKYKKQLFDKGLIRKDIVD